MGMFDWVRCEYPLPAEGAPNEGYQTKDTSAQSCDLYLIASDGGLYHEDYEIEDRGNKESNNPLERLAGCMTPVNKRWRKEADFTGEVRFYGDDEDDRWYEFSAYFKDGGLREINVIESPPREDEGI